VNEKNKMKMSLRINGIRTVVIGTKGTAPLMQQDKFLGQDNLAHKEGQPSASRT